jgi:pilus assembly protein CpaE
MSGRPPSGKQETKGEITILLVDDIPEARENVKKLLAFEPDFKVVGSAGTGREGVDLAQELKPDIIIMDINMPDMDGLVATSQIKKAVPTCAVIIMSVQNDPDYMRRAMLAGARDFLTKPPNMDELYNTIRTVYKQTEEVRQQYASMSSMPTFTPTKSEGPGTRGGNIIAVYSPQGGCGKTTIATNLASGLMKEGIKVLLVDADLQFADVSTFLYLQAQSTIVEVAEDVDDLDVELFENIVVTHGSGLKVLAGPPRPEFADTLRARPETVGLILEKVAKNYDFIIVDCSSSLDEVALNILDRATRIALVATPTIPALRNVRFVMDLFDQLGYDQHKTTIVLNKTYDDKKDRGSTIPADKVRSFLKREIAMKIPHVDERIILSAINKGVPVIASDRDQSKPPIRQLLDLADYFYHELMGDDDLGEDAEESQDKRRGMSLFRGR